MNNKQLLIIVIIGYFIALIGGYVLAIELNHYKIYDGIEHYNKSIAEGLYWPDTDYYCVWANLRTISYQEKTDRHEYCHYLIDNNYNHFCE